MSLLTCIFGFIETDRYEREQNTTVLNQLTYDRDFVEMFCIPKNSGTKNPDYILFGATINYCDFPKWIERFEAFIKQLEAFNAFVFVDHRDGAEVFAIGYQLEFKFSKRILDLGDDYGTWETDYPLIFRVLLNPENFKPQRRMK